MMNYMSWKCQNNSSMSSSYDVHLAVLLASWFFPEFNCQNSPEDVPGSRSQPVNQALIIRSNKMASPCQVSDFTLDQLGVQVCAGSLHGGHTVLWVKPYSHRICLCHVTVFAVFTVRQEKKRMFTLDAVFASDSCMISTLFSTLRILNPFSHAIQISECNKPVWFNKYWYDSH